MFVSLHGKPSVSYPYYSGFSGEVGAGHGEGFNLNYPLPKNTAWESYRDALLHACKKLQQFAPEVLVISFAARLFAKVGIRRVIREMATYIEADCLRWAQFDKSPRTANHCRTV